MPSPLDWSKIQVRLSSCARVRCEPGWRLGPNWGRNLADFDLWLVWAGKGRMQTRSGELVLRPGTCLWMRPGGQYEATQDESDRLGVNFVHFMLHDTDGRPQLDSEAIPGEVREVENLAFFEAGMNRIIELRRRLMLGPPVARDENGELPELLLQGLLRDFEAGAVPDQTKPLPGLPKHHREVIFRQVARIYESPAVAPDVCEMAKQSGYSPDHFSRVFKAVTGQTPQAMKIEARIERARQLLAESSLSVGMVAGAVGYDSVFFFSRQFKEKTGMSPTAYRRQPPSARPRSKLPTNTITTRGTGGPR